jgi:hypothetical protein
MKPKTKCRWVGHDWEVLETRWNDDGFYTLEKKVCMRCLKVIDDITPYEHGSMERKRIKAQRKADAAAIFKEHFYANN